MLFFVWVFLLLGLWYLCREWLDKVWGWVRYHISLERTFLVGLAVCELAVLFMAAHAKKASCGDGFLDRLFYGLKTMVNVLECDSGCFRALFRPWDIYWHAATLLSILVPVFSVGTLLIFLLSFTVVINPFGEYVVFSQLDERSLLMAQSLHENRSGKYLHFLFLRTKRKDQPTDLLLRLRDIPHQLYPLTETDLMTRHWTLQWRKLTFFFLGENTDENFDRLDSFLKAVEKKTLFYNCPRFEDRYRQEASRASYRQELYLLSETSSAPMLIDHLRRQLCDGNKRKDVFAYTELQLLDRYRAVSYRLLRTVPIYANACNNRNHVLLLGLGQAGQAFFRCAHSFCPMDGCTTEFYLCDSQIHHRYNTMLQALGQT